MVEYYDREHPCSTLLLVSDNDLADARGNVYENNWHQYDTFEKIHNAVNLPQMIELADTWKLQYFIGRTAYGTSPGDSVGLRQFLAECTQTEFEHAGFFLARIDNRCAGLPDSPPTLPGTYDDFDPGLRFHGEWIHSDEFSEAWQHTISYTDTPGAEASMLFQGQGLTYVFTRAPNRGFAEILIDGAGRGALDLYAPKAEWQGRYRICCLSPGRHTAVIRVLGKSRPESTGRFVDVDALIVEQAGPVVPAH